MMIPEWKSEDKWCVYKHTSPSGKSYVGITKNTKKRWRNNGVGYKTQKRFWTAICKYGWDNFKHEILYIDLSRDDAEHLEIETIHELDLTNFYFGYNSSRGGNYFPVEAAHSPEAIEKARQTRKKNRANGKRNKSLGMKYPPEICKKFSEAHKGLLLGEKHPLWGKHLPEETRKKISESSKGKKLSEETKKKISQKLTGLQSGEKHPLYGKHHSDETIQKMKEAHMGHLHIDEEKKKISEAHKKDGPRRIIRYWVFQKQMNTE